MDMPIIIEPRFNAMTVNVSLILHLLMRDKNGITYKVIGRVIGSNWQTVRSWANTQKRPKCVFMTYILIDFACRFIKPIDMNKCGVTG